MVKWPPWTPQEEEFLMARFDKDGIKKCAQALGRSERAIKRKAKLMGVVVSNMNYTQTLVRLDKKLWLQYKNKYGDGSIPRLEYLIQQDVGEDVESTPDGEESMSVEDNDFIPIVKSDEKEPEGADEDEDFIPLP